MAMIMWIIIGLLVLGLTIAVLAYCFRGKKHEMDYYTFFIIGVIWLPLGIATDNLSFTAMGAVFIAIGLAHKDKWKKNKICWKDKSQRQKMILAFITAFLGALFLAGIVVYFFMN